MTITAYWPLVSKNMFNDDLSELAYTYIFNDFISSFTEIYEKYITAWRRDDNVYIETHTFDKMLKKVLSQPFMTFVGAPGSGKTATVRHIALKLQEEGYEILPIKDIGHLETYCDPHNPQVFIIDDALGSFGLDMSAFCMLDNFFKNSEYPQCEEQRF